VLGEEHQETLRSMNNLAGLYLRQGKYGQAEPLYVTALERRARVLGEQHPDALLSIDNLASLFARQGKYAQAERVYARAADLRHRAWSFCEAQIPTPTAVFIAVSRPNVAQTFRFAVTATARL
jgi:tetratricopeptide (TPR) repeat protein